MTLSLRPDDRGGLRSMEKWPNSAGMGWGNQQHRNALELSTSPLCYTAHTLQSQSTFPQLMRSASQEVALAQAFAQARADSRDANHVSSLDHALLWSCKSSSMVASSTSDDDDCMADMQDRAGSTGAPTVAPQDFYRPAEASPGGDDWVPGAVACASVMTGLERRVEAGDEEWMDHMNGRKVRKGQQCEQLPRAFHDSNGACAEAPSSSSWVSPMPYNSPDPAMIMPAASTPFWRRVDAGGGSASEVDLDSVRATFLRHASQPVPSLAEIASSRPRRRNVRISKDPQSVAARHRRERISDRMRVLQWLVPGGTKMDTASMLDEAIHYVKFLKLQLQTLEQIGSTNNRDAQGSFAQPRQGASEAQLGSLARRPLDLNCARAFQAWPVNSTNSNPQASPHGRL